MNDDTRDTVRHTDEVQVTDLVEGDRIDPALVSNRVDGIGTLIARNINDDGPQRRRHLGAATKIDRVDDVHHAILVDGETGALALASCVDSQSAMSQKEADWTVREVGTEVAVDTVDDLDLPDEEMPDENDSAAGYVAEWLNIVLSERALGDASYRDEIKVTTTRTVSVRDADGRQATADISLAGGDQ